MDTYAIRVVLIWWGKLAAEAFTRLLMVFPPACRIHFERGNG